MRAKSVVIILIFYLHLRWSENCPPSCHCIDSLTNCNRKNLRKLLSGIPDNTTVLVMSHNNISSVQRNDFNELPNLRMLIIANSSLTFFDTQVIKKFTNLTVLDLRGNMLTEISRFPRHMKLKSGYTFSLLQNTSYLNLKNNPLSNISVDSFKDLKSLTRLNLKNTSIRTLATGIFSGLKSVM